MKFALLIMVSAGLVAGQTPAFEVATLKIARPEGDSITINLGTMRNGRVTLGNATLSDCIKFAYGLSADVQLAGPEWIRREPRFDISAQAPPATTPDQLRLMTRRLLRERLHLALGSEQRVVPHLALLRGAAEPKMLRAEPAPPPNAAPQIPGRIAHNQLTMPMLAALLSRFERQTIVDLTAIPGAYQVKLEWAPDRFTASEDDRPPDERPSLTAALRSQLGLRLEARRGPIEVLVVEAANKVPEEN